jgi:hypothetical protein
MQAAYPGLFTLVHHLGEESSTAGGTTTAGGSSSGRTRVTPGAIQVIMSGERPSPQYVRQGMVNRGRTTASAQREAPGALGAVLLMHRRKAHNFNFVMVSLSCLPLICISIPAPAAGSPGGALISLDGRLPDLDLPPSQQLPAALMPLISQVGQGRSRLHSRAVCYQTDGVPC